MKRPKIGLALGGGGARGISHIGVLKILEKHGIPIDCIAGTSIGAIIGGGYAVNPDAAYLEQKVQRFVESDAYLKSGLQHIALNEPAENFWGQVAKSVRERIVINLAHSKSSIVSGWRLKKIIDFVLDDVNIEKAKIPLAIVATDLEDGHEVIFQCGSLRQAVLASASIPGFLPPVDYMGYTLIDGAITSPVPVETAFSMGADLVIAVDVGQSLEKAPEPLSIIDIIFRTNTISGIRLCKLTLTKADVVIR
ncbi:MAG: patatin-like phospholipase family protein, partial [bacterium]